MRKLLEYLLKFNQKADEKEDKYRKRLNEDTLRCGNVQSENDNITLYVDGLSPKINMVVTHHRQSVHRRYLTSKVYETLLSCKKAYCVRLCHITSNFTNQ